MRPNPHLIARLKGIQHILMAHHGAGAGLPTSMLGYERETLVSEFLGRVFPSHRRFTTGCITDAYGTKTGQVDIAIEYGFMPTFLTPTSNPRLLLAESVAAVIEVKSNLSSQWSQVEDKTADIRTIKRNLQPMYGGHPRTMIPVIAVGYKGDKTRDELKKRMADSSENIRPDAALVVESGSFVCAGLESEGPEGLLALCILITKILEQIGFATWEPQGYLSEKTFYDEDVVERLLEDPTLCTP